MARAVFTLRLRLAGIRALLNCFYYKLNLYRFCERIALGRKAHHNGNRILPGRKPGDIRRKGDFLETQLIQISAQPADGDSDAIALYMVCLFF